jgi:diadenosine tetraphosphate (Ap4A) HIT family hydrolase
MSNYEKCIYCEFLEDENFSKRIIMQNDEYVAFLDAFPLVEGHTLVIPRAHYPYVWDVPNFGEYFEFSKQVANMLKTRLGVQKVDILVSGGTVAHSHIHLLPYTGGKWDEVKEHMRALRKTIVQETKFSVLDKLGESR